MADEQGIEIPGLPEGHPPLMIFAKRRLSTKALENFRDSLSRALRENRMALLEPDFDVYQMIDGRWQLIHPDA